MQGNRVKYLFYGALILAALGFVKFAFFPTPYQKARWWQDAGFRRFSKFDFATYEIPKHYEPITFRRDDYSRQRLLLFKEKEGYELITLVMFKGFPEVDFDKVTVNAAEPKRPFFRAERYYLYEGDFFAIWHYFPFGFRDDFENSGKDVEIRGLKLESREAFETAGTRVLYLKGEFMKLGFYKKSGNWRPFMNPVLDYMGERKGALAIINDKETGKTIFAVGCNYPKAGFNEAEFRRLVESLTFDHIPFEDAVKAFDEYVGIGDDSVNETVQWERIRQVDKNYIGDIVDISQLRKKSSEWQPTRKEGEPPNLRQST